MKRTLPTDSAARKDIPLFSGVLRYAPAAIAGMARISVIGNKKHNPGGPLHHARGKSTDYQDCIVRHLQDADELITAHERGVAEVDPQQILDEVDQLVWRAVLYSQTVHERFGDAPLAPGARLPQLGHPDDSLRLNAPNVVQVCTCGGPSWVSLGHHPDCPLYA